jgi:putative heme-binding domain-containing protein
MSSIRNPEENMTKIALAAAVAATLAAGAALSGAEGGSAPSTAERREELRRFALHNKGDAGRGNGVARKLSCRSCHDLDGEEKGVGPPLGRVGDRLSREEIVDQVLEPARRAAGRYVLVQFTDGKSRRFRLEGEDDVALKVRDETTGAALTLKKSELQAYAPARSGMPEGLADALTPQDFTDLVEFLLARKAP